MKFKNVVDNLNILKLDKIADCLSEYVDKVNSEKIPFLDALYELTKLEMQIKLNVLHNLILELHISHTIELLKILTFLSNHRLIKNKCLN